MPLPEPPVGGFLEGEVVECIDNTNDERLTIGSLYTISMPSLTLTCIKEIPNSSYFIERFKRIDMSLFDKGDSLECVNSYGTTLEECVSYTVAGVAHHEYLVVLEGVEGAYHDSRFKKVDQPLHKQVSGTHYISMGMQPLEFTYLNYGFIGLKAAIHTKVNKYFRKKGDEAKELEDLKKALHCIEILIEKAEIELKNK